MTKLEEVPVKRKRGRPKGYKVKPKKRTREEILADLERLDNADISDLEYLKEYKRTHLWEYFRPFLWQERSRNLLKQKLIVLAPSANKIGKTANVACTIMSWLAGYEAWHKVDSEYEGAVKVEGEWYRPSSLEIKPPVRIRLTGEDWNVHLGQTVVPELKKWFPMDKFDTRKNTNGVEYLWTHKPTGSTLELMTHGMDDSLYESWLGDGWVPDEPPPEKKYKGMQRGLFLRRGKTFIPATPLKEAWLLDELVLKTRSDVGVITDLCCLDNELYYDADDKLLEEMGLSGGRSRFWREMEGQKKQYYEKVMRWDLYTDQDDDKRKKPDDQGESAERYLKEIVPEELHEKIMDLRFLKFAKDTTPDEKPSRFFGMFKKLVGLVCKEYNRAKHILPAGDGVVPTNWIVTFQIDFHLSKPHALVFYACSERNIHYVIHEVWENMSARELADVIIRKKKVEGWNIEYGEIDPLSKGDDKYIRNRDADAVDSFTILSDALDEEDIELGVASKDKKSGFANIKSWLKGPNKIPLLYFLDNLQSIEQDMYGTCYEIQRLCYDDKGEIEKVNDHFMECLYRYTLMNVQYEERKKESPLLLGTSGGAGWAG